MELATEEETLRFLNGLFFSWGQTILKCISKEYNLEEDQIYALETILLKPNDWKITIKQPLHSN
jgi:hypothetical protein